MGVWRPVRQGKDLSNGERELVGMNGCTKDCEAHGLCHTSCMGSVAEGHAVLAIFTACSSVALQECFLGACRPGVETSSRCFAGVVKLQPLLRLYVLI